MSTCVRDVLCVLEVKIGQNLQKSEFIKFYYYLLF